MTTIFRVIPLGKDGEVSGDEYYTGSYSVAAKAFAMGASVMVGEVSSWETVGMMPATKTPKHPVYGRD